MLIYEKIIKKKVFHRTDRQTLKHPYSQTDFNQKIICFRKENANIKLFVYLS
jgi:hypothetical protein